MAKLRLEVVTAEREVFADDVDMVVAPGGEGEVGILPRHAPLLTTLQPGVLRLKKDGEETFMAVSGGFMQVFRDRVLVLADAAERAEEIDEDRADAARQRALQALREGAGGAGALQAEAAKSALRVSMVRLQVARRRSRRSMQ